MAERSADVGELLARARAGSREALGEALEACRAYLLLIAGARLDPELRGKGGASDLVQETFLEAQRDFAGFHGTNSHEWRAWLRRLLLNNLVDFTRHYRDTEMRDAVEVPLDDSDGPALDLVAGDTPASDRAIAREQVEEFEAGLTRLPDEYRQVILLRYQERLSFEEVGHRVGRTPNAARMLWLRAIERLKKEMGKPP